jgi:endo-1,4-beta-mannosidase
MRQICLLLLIGFVFVVGCSKDTIENPEPSIPQSIPYCGTNYYPANFAWKMWNRDGWQNSSIPNEIETELSKAKDLGINMTRIFINYNAFGKSQPSFDVPEVNYLKQYLNMAKATGMGVVITLFDDCIFDGTNVVSFNNAVVTTQSAIAHVDALVNLFDGYDNIVAWDLINEPDGKGFFNFSSGSWNATGLDWLVAIFNSLKADLKNKDSAQRITLGTVMGTGILTMVSDKFPGLLPQIHQYTPYSNSSQFYAKVVQDINDVYYAYNEPVFIGEFGSPADIADNNALKKQAEIYDALLKAVEDNSKKVHSVANWTLFDFNNVTGDEGIFGTITLSGELKESAEILRNYYQSWQQAAAN